MNEAEMVHGDIAVDMASDGSYFRIGINTTKTAGTAYAVLDPKQAKHIADTIYQALAMVEARKSGRLN